MLVSSLITWCNSLYDGGGDSVEDNTWIMHFNDAQFDLLPYLQLEGASLTDLVDEQESYELPSDYYDVYLVQEKSSGEYLEMKEIPFWDTTRNGYKIFGDSIYLKIGGKAPTSVTDGLRIYYYKKPAELTATTDTIEIADPYLLGLFALARVETGDRALTQSSKYYSEYLDRRIKSDNEMAQIVEEW